MNVNGDAVYICSEGGKEMQYAYHKKMPASEPLSLLVYGVLFGVPLRHSFECKIGLKDKAELLKEICSRQDEVCLD